MRLRPFRKNSDYTYIEKWVRDKRTHALWCANIVPYPMTLDGLEAVLEKDEKDWGGCAYTFTENSGKPVGFCVCRKAKCV